MEVLLTALFGSFLIYSLITLLLSSSDKVMMRVRFLKYFKNAGVDEVQTQVLKEKLENAKKKKSYQFQFASKQLSSYLIMSGVKLSASEYIGLWVLFTFAPMLFVLIFRGNMITAAGISIVGFSLPPFLVTRARKKRQEEFNKQLGDSLVIMRNCIKAGFTFQQAMESIASEMHPPISTEFSKTLREVRYGVSMEDALKHMVERVQNKDLDLLVSAVLTSTKVGGNLSEILEIIAETIKDRIKIKAEVRVITSSGRTSGIIIGLLPVAIILILMLLNPEYFQSFFENDIGKLMLMVSIVLETIGFIIINKIVDIKY